ncbi:MAG: hypothetical protein ACLRWH_09550 [Emergencia sp.]
MDNLLYFAAKAAVENDTTRLINRPDPHYYEGKMSGNWVNEAKVSSSHFMIRVKNSRQRISKSTPQFFNVDTTSEITFDVKTASQS